MTKDNRHYVVPWNSDLPPIPSRFWHQINPDSGAIYGDHRIGREDRKLDPEELAEIYVAAGLSAALPELLRLHATAYPSPEFEAAAAALTEKVRSILSGIIQPMPEAGLGYVYLIAVQDPPDFVKIGFSMDPDLRLEELSKATPNPLVLLAAWPGTQFDEKQLHEDFASYRHRAEWFRVEGSLAEFVAKQRLIPLPDFSALPPNRWQRRMQWLREPTNVPAK